MRPASLADAAMPSAITEAGETGTLSPLYKLADAKNSIGMSLEQSDQDAYIVHLLGQAQAIIEASTGLKFSPAAGATAEFILPYGCRAICIPESDLDEVQAVTEYDDDGVAHVLERADYVVKRSYGRVYIVRTDDECFEDSDCDGEVSVEVNYTRGVKEDTGRAFQFRAAMSQLVASLYDGHGTYVPAKMRANADYTRNLRLLQNQTPD